MNPTVALQVGVDLEFGIALIALERGVTCVRSEVNGQLAGVAAGVRAYLTLKGSLIIVDAKMLLQATAVGRCVRTVLTLVRFLSRVQTAVKIQLIATTKAFMAEFTLERPLT